tara:strand:+ start:985 stop:2883 length:1899 start_codon:yes stop_codon:yes gene_type:complete
MASGLLDKANIILTPTGYKAGTMYNVAPIDSPYEDFDFARASVASRVNSSGLVEIVGRTLGSNLVQNGDFSELGSELVTNGDFATDSDWTKGAGWSISGGVASSDGSQTGNSAIQQSGIAEVGNIYKITFDLVVSSGFINYVNLGGWIDNTNLTTSGTYTYYTDTTTATDNLGIAASADFVGTIDNVSVKQVDPNDYWTLGGGATIGNNKANIDGDGSTYVFINQSNIFTNQGATYKVTADVVITSGLGLKFQDGVTNENIGAATTTGSYTFYFTAGSNSTLVIARRTGGTAFDSSVTNVSVQEVIDTNNIPRINYDSNGENGHWLLEPTSTNLLPYSEDFSEWTLGSNSTLTYESDVVAPDGSLGVYRLTNPATSSTFIQSPSFSSSNPLTVSLYVKSTGSGNDNFNFYTGATNISDLKTATSEWQRFDYTADGSSMYIINSGDTYASDIYIWGAQAEALSYATSYIPTLTGSTETRATETATGAGSADLINSTEGVLYAEIAALANDGTFRAVSISDGSTSNVVRYYFSTTDNRIVGNVKSSGSNVFSFNHSLTTVTDYIKIALKYKANDFALWVNGAEVGTDSSGSVPIGLNELAFDNGAGNDDFYGKCKALAVFNEALTDAELTELTS